MQAVAHTQVGDSTHAAVLDAVLRASPTFLHVLRGPQFIVEFANDAYYRLVGQRDLIGRPAFEAMPEAADGGYQARLLHVLQTHEPFEGRELPVTLSRTLGEPSEERLIDVVYMPLLEPDGSCIRVLGHGTDVTEQVRERQARDDALSAAKQALADANHELAAEVDATATVQQRLQSVVMHAPAIVGVFEGPEHRIVLANSYFVAALGRGPLEGRLVREVMPEWADLGMFELLDRAYRTGVPHVVHEQLVPMPQPDGGEPEDHWYHWVWQPLTNASGRVTGMLQHAVDVTEQVRARQAVEAALAQAQSAYDEAEGMRREAEAANAAKAQFLAKMSHELRTPLNAISGYTQLLELGVYGPVPATQRVVLSRVHSAETLLMSLINDVLNHAKLESGKVEFDIRAVDLGEVLREVVPMVELQVRAKGLQLDVRQPNVAGREVPCLVQADHDKLVQVLLNLLANAVKFTKTPRDEDGAPGRVSLNVVLPRGAAGEDSVAFVRIQDTGRGIPRDKQDAIFEPFVQLRAGAGAGAGVFADATEGTGLGLAISRDLARGMGGELRVRSTPGHGATFTVTLQRSGGVHSSTLTP